MQRYALHAKTTPTSDSNVDSLTRPRFEFIDAEFVKLKQWISERDAEISNITFESGRGDYYNKDKFFSEVDKRFEMGSGYGKGDYNLLEKKVREFLTEVLDSKHVDPKYPNLSQDISCNCVFGSVLFDTRLSLARIKQEYEVRHETLLLLLGKAVAIAKENITIEAIKTTTKQNHPCLVQ